MMASVIEATGTRHFIDWRQPPLPTAAERLVDWHADDEQLDMSGSVIVVPGSKAGRRLMELILDRAEQRRLIFTPPEITTIGNFPELLYRPARQLAGPLVQHLAWVSALHNIPTKQLQQFTSYVPDEDDSQGWLTLAKMLNNWHRELGGHGLSFQDVLQATREKGNPDEQRRWELLLDIQRQYLNVLHQQDLWDRQTARLVAIRNEECATDKRIYLVGTVDLNTTFRQTLAQVAQQVTAIIFADESWADMFDAHGCLNVERWRDVEIEIAENQIAVADQPIDQARLIAKFLGRLDGRYAVDQISIAVPDENLVSPINRTLKEFNVNSHPSSGRPVTGTRPFLLLDLIANWLADQRFTSFAQLVRHPDMHQWISGQVGGDRWLTELDLYQNERLPFFISFNPDRVYFEGKDRHGDPLFANLASAYHHLQQLMEPLVERRRPLAEWSHPWQQILGAVYETHTVDRTSPIGQRMMRACQELMTGLTELSDYGELWPEPMDAVAAFTWLSSIVSDVETFDVQPPESLSLLGWLDLPLDDAPVSVVTSVNEGWIPSRESSSLFLPNSRRSELGLVDNDRRYARDVYALSLILRSREKVLLICGRRDGDQQPLLPSRLLMTGDSQSIARRALRLFADGAVTTDFSLDSADGRPKHQQFELPRPLGADAPINSLRVTDFKNYLICPYRFYLTRVLNLERLHDRRDELDGAQFGSLVHDVVEHFGRSDIKSIDDEEAIKQHLHDYLNRLALARYGRRPMPAVQIQLEQARLRLDAFARWQAEHRRQGWEIFEVERQQTSYEFLVDEQPFEVRGRIDRIDINREQRKIGVYDYKTSDVPKGPRALHQNRNEWTDLQLPLYRWLVKSFADLPAGYDVELGLILITKDTNKIRLELADWTQDELESADHRAFQIMRDVRAGKFWPPADKAPIYMDDLAGICQSTVFERWVPEDDPAQAGGGKP